MNYWINRIREYWNDKKLADKCGLQVKDICVHEWGVVGFYRDSRETESIVMKKCLKCGEVYK